MLAGRNQGAGSDDYDDSDFDVMPDLSPELHELVESLLDMGPELAVRTLEKMVMEGDLDEEEFYLVTMAMEQYLAGDFDDEEDDDEDEDEDEDEDDEDDLGEGLVEAENDLIESLGPEFIFNIVHNFDAEKAVLARIQPESKRSERLKAVFDWIELKKTRLVAMNRQYYGRAFSDSVHFDADKEESEEEPVQKRKAAATKAKEAVAGLALDGALLAKAAELYAREECLPLSEDLVHMMPLVPSRSEFLHATLWARGRRFDGTLKEDPASVRFAREGDLPMVQALLVAGCSVDLCSSWGYKDFWYDRETALVAAARNERTEVVEFLLKAGADPAHTFFEREPFLQKLEEAGDTEMEQVDQEETDEQPFSFNPPKFRVPLEPEELTIVKVLEKDAEKNAQMLQLLKR